MRELLPHQRTALDYLFANSGGALFMQMRLGKTLVCIRYVQKKFGLGKAKVLVVAPVEGLWAWQRELRMEGEAPTVLTGTKLQRIRKLWGGGLYGWYLINYEGVRTIVDKLELKHWDCIILDESRRIANPSAKISKLLTRFPSHHEDRIVLSGEPAPEGPLEYFNQMVFWNTSFMGCRSYWQFRHNFFRELAPHEWLPTAEGITRIKQELHRNAFFLSRKQAGIPDRKVYEVRALQMPKEIRRAYEEIRTDFVASLDGQHYTTKWVPVQYMWMHQLSSGFLGERLVWDGKVRETVGLLTGELAKEQVVVWFKFNAGLEAVSRQLGIKGIAHGRLVGEMPREAREVSINRFREGKLRILLCQVKCGKTAIDLSNSSTAVYFSNTYSLEERLQSEDRILNPLKREPLLYLDLITERTVEEDLVEVLADKAGDSKFYMSRLIAKLQESVLC